jgi:hypothetical protein
MKASDTLPTDPPIVGLAELASRIEATLDRYVERLNFGEYDDLRDYATRLFAYYHLLTAEDREAFLGRELEQAQNHHNYIVKRIGGDR